MSRSHRHKNTAKGNKMNINNNTLMEMELTKSQDDEVRETGSVIVSGREVFCVAQTDDESCFATSVRRNGNLYCLKNSDEIDTLIESGLIDDDDKISDNYCNSYLVRIPNDRKKFFKFCKKNNLGMEK